jgi:hypothetical protein
MEMQKLYYQKQSTPGSFAFLLLSLPFGLLYFVATITLLSIGLGTLVIWIGLPIILLTMIMIHGFALLERSMAHSLLGITFPAQRVQPLSEASLWRRFTSFLQDPLTWTGMIYMLLVKLPLGIISFTLVLVLPLVSAALALLPLIYLLNLFINGILVASGVSATSILVPFFIVIHGAMFDPLMFARCFIGVPVGILSWFISRSLLNSMAQVAGMLVRALLAPASQDRESAFSANSPTSSQEYTYYQPHAEMIHHD